VVLSSVVVFCQLILSGFVSSGYVSYILFSWIRVAIMEVVPSDWIELGLIGE
jgi:hypothetical protein